MSHFNARVTSPPCHTTNFGRRVSVRHTEYHADSRRVADTAKAWLDAHPGYSARSLSRAAAVGDGYVSRLLRGDCFETDAVKAAKLLRTMRAMP